MQRLVQRSAAALALAALAAGHGPGPALADHGGDHDARTDLQIEVVGLKPGSRREVLIRVSNVGRWWVDQTQATVETVPRQAGDPITARVPDLDPKQEPQGPTPHQFEFSYTLTADCDGHVVKASLSTATDWKGDQEANTANNVAQREACPKVQAPPPPPPPPPPGGGDLGVVIDPDAAIGDVLGGPGPVFNEDALKPEHQRKGAHTLSLVPSAERRAVRTTAFFELIPGFTGTWSEGLLVGWAQEEGDYVWVAQSAVNFDFSLLDDVPTKTLNSAVLRYAEAPEMWKSGGGGFQQKAGCVEVLGRATSDWIAHPPADSLFPNEKILGSTPGVREWTVTQAVELWVTNQRPRLGFVLRGGNDDPQGDDDTSCMSLISGVELIITYTVPD